MKSFNFLLPLLVCSLSYMSLAQQNSPTYNFEMFLETALKNYPTWLGTNNRDPTAANGNEVVLMDAREIIYTSYLKIKDERMLGHSSTSNQLKYSAEVDTVRQFIYLKFENNGPITFEGKYTANGTLFVGEPYAGEGNWNFTTNQGLSENVTYRYNIKPNGYVDISQGRVEYKAKSLVGSDIQVMIDGVIDEAFSETAKEYITEDFLEAYEKTRIGQLYTEHPAASLIHRYFEELFEVKNLFIHLFIKLYFILKIRFQSNLIQFAENSLL